MVADPAGFDTRTLVDRCRERLSAYKVPERVHEIAGIPRTASGKVTRRLLADQPSRLRYAADGHHDALMGVDWTPLAVPTNSALPARSWAVAGPAAADLVTALGAVGADVRHYPDLAALHAALADGQAAPDVTILVRPTGPEDAQDPIAAGRGDARLLADHVHARLARAEPAASRLVVLTRGAVAATVEDGAQNLADAPIWAVARSFQEIDPTSLTVLDLDAGADLDPDALLAALATDEPQVALRSGAVLVPRLTRLPLVDTPTARPWPGAAGTVVVTGADTGHGAVLARRLATVHRAESLLLVSSPGTGTTSGTEPVPAETTVMRVTADGANPEPLRAALAALRHPVTAVVHAADDPELALHLDEMTAEDGLAAFVVVSDIAGLLGSPDAPGTAVSGILSEAVVRNRTLRDLPGSFVAWGGWPADRGSADDDAGRLLNRLLSAFDIALTTNRPSLLALRPGPPAQGARVPAMLSAVVETPSRRPQPDGTVTAALRDRLSGLEERAQLALLEDLVRTQAAAVLRLPESERVPADRAFRDLGFTSMAIVALRNRLTESTGLRLPTTVIFDHPTPVALAAGLRAEVLGDHPTGDRIGHGGRCATSRSRSSAWRCRLPGGVAAPGGAVAAGRRRRRRDRPGSPPTAAGTWTACTTRTRTRAGTSYAREGGFLHDAAEFDAGFFGISPREALAMDPQQRLLLETSWEALERAGDRPAVAAGQPTGVFVGVHRPGLRAPAVDVAPESWRASLDRQRRRAWRRAGCRTRSGLEGPAVTVDTACSSSLVALHLAAQALRPGECDLALAGGVTVMATPGAVRGVLPAARAGRRRPVQGVRGRRGRHGLGRGRGCAGAGAAVGRAAQRAPGAGGGAGQRGEPGRCVERSDGAERSVAAAGDPAGAGGRRAVAASDVDVVEAHGTGTRLGDPIEAQALLATYGQERDRGGRCGWGR